VKSEHRYTPWANPNPISETLINRKGLMDMIQMGILPKTIDFTDLLNDKYVETVKKEQQPQFQNLFITNTNESTQLKKSSEKFHRSQAISASKGLKRHESASCNLIKMQHRK
jgi:hypothetical protein